MAAPTVRGVGAFGSGTTSFVAAVPTGGGAPQAGDALYIIMESSDSSTAAGTPTTPNGWTKLFENTIGAGATNVLTLTVFGKIAGAGEGNVTINGVGDHCAGAMISIAGHGLSAITDTVVGAAADHGTSTANLLAPSITVTADSLIITCMGLSDDANDTTNVSGVTNANLASITERIDQTVATGAGGGVGIYTATCAGTSTGTTEWDHDTAVNSQSVQLGIKSAAVAAALEAVVSAAAGLAASVLTTAITLFSALGGATAAAAQLTTSITFESAAASAASASVPGMVSAATQFDAVAPSTGAAASELTTGITLGAASGGSAGFAGQLTTSIPLASAAGAAVASAADLATAIGFAAAQASSTSQAAALSTSITFDASTSTSASCVQVSTLTTAIMLASAASGVVTVASDLAGAAAFAAAAPSSLAAAGQLGTAISLNSVGQLAAQHAADLSTAIEFASSLLFGTSVVAPFTAFSEPPSAIELAVATIHSGVFELAAVRGSQIVADAAGQVVSVIEVTVTHGD